jgi:LPXTG-motif cell wall-anchored protein
VLAETQTVAPQQVASARASRAQTLPVTGGDVVGLAAVGAAAVAGGAALLAVRRRRSEA